MMFEQTKVISKFVLGSEFLFDEGVKALCQFSCSLQFSAKRPLFFPFISEVTNCFEFPLESNLMTESVLVHDAKAE